jgi:hypothetical protein
LFFFRTMPRVVEQMNALDAQKRVGVSP